LLILFSKVSAKRLQSISKVSATYQQSVGTNTSESGNERKRAQQISKKNKVSAKRQGRLSSQVIDAVAAQL